MRSQAGAIVTVMDKKLMEAPGAHAINEERLEKLKLSVSRKQFAFALTAESVKVTVVGGSAKAAGGGAGCGVAAPTRAQPPSSLSKRMHTKI